MTTLKKLPQDPAEISREKKTRSLQPPLHSRIKPTWSCRHTARKHSTPWPEWAHKLYCVTPHPHPSLLPPASAAHCSRHINVKSKNMTNCFWNRPPESCKRHVEQQVLLPLCYCRTANSLAHINRWCTNGPTCRWGLISGVTVCVCVSFDWGCLCVLVGV